MSEPFLGEIRMFAGNYAPQGWALCQGQSFSIRQYTALFALLGVAYGGNGTTSFNLPNLGGSVPINQGQGTGLSQYYLGQVGGEINHTLTSQELPAHTHAFNGSHAAANSAQASGYYYGSSTRTGALYGASSSPTAMAPGVVAANAGGQPHPNQQPFLTLSFIISLQGIFPQRP